jgi:lipoprotein signal peptidase
VVETQRARAVPKIAIAFGGYNLTGSRVAVRAVLERRPVTRTTIWRLFAACGLSVAAVDILSKRLAAWLLAGRDVPLIGHAVRLAVVLNDQSAFSIPLGPYTWHINTALTLLALGLTVALCEALARIDVWAPIVLGLIAGAAAGNLLSLLFEPGGVIDFVAIDRGGGRELVFNLADVAAVLGLLLIIRTGVRVVQAIRAGEPHIILRR